NSGCGCDAINTWAWAVHGMALSSRSARNGAAMSRLAHSAIRCPTGPTAAPKVNSRQSFHPFLPDPEAHGAVFSAALSGALQRTSCFAHSDRHPHYRPTGIAG